MPNRSPKNTPAAAETDPELELPTDFGDYKVAGLPIISNFCHQIGLTGLVDTRIESPEKISSGQVVVGMVMDTLSGRSPLYKMHEYFIGMDLELLFGSKDLQPCDFNDNNLGKVLDNIHAYGASKLFSEISMKASRHFTLDAGHLHFDTTSVSLHGDYDAYQNETEHIIGIKYGHSKDHRPDLKQFMISSLCIEGGVPLLGAVLSGNTSDKKANNTELTRVASLMKKHGLDPKAHVYIADSAMVNKDNLQAIQDKAQPFITRLGAVYNEEQHAIEAAFEANDWTEVGVLAQKPDPSKKRQSARYKIAETTVTLYGTEYRAIVVHSTAHDKRRTKKLEKQLKADQATYEKLQNKLSKTSFACEPDALQHAGQLKKDSGLKHHDLHTSIHAEPVYAKGRPPKNGPRKIKAMRYHIQAQISPREQDIQNLRERSGCFVLISNLPADQNEEHAHSGTEILKAYKEQYGIENNFRFLKDPIIVNDTFLKKAERIEALGFILLISLMLWNLIQLIIRRHIKKHNKTILGWDNKQTHAPTTMMVLHYFQHISIFVWNQGRRRRLSRALNEHQKDYLAAIGLPETIFTIPVKICAK